MRRDAVRSIEAAMVAVVLTAVTADVRISFMATSSFR